MENSTARASRPYLQEEGRLAPRRTAGLYEARPATDFARSLSARRLLASSRSADSPRRAASVIFKPREMKVKRKRACALRHGVRMGQASPPPLRMTPWAAIAAPVCRFCGFGAAPALLPPGTPPWPRRGYRPHRGVRRRTAQARLREGAGRRSGWRCADARGARVWRGVMGPGCFHTRYRRKGRVW
jgi:hypothetical protein